MFTGENQRSDAAEKTLLTASEHGAAVLELNQKQESVPNAPRAVFVHVARTALHTHFREASATAEMISTIGIVII